MVEGISSSLFRISVQTFVVVAATTMLCTATARAEDTPADPVPAWVASESGEDTVTKEDIKKEGGSAASNTQAYSFPAPEFYQGKMLAVRTSGSWYTYALVEGGVLQGAITWQGNNGANLQFKSSSEAVAFFRGQGIETPPAIDDLVNQNKIPQWQLASTSNDITDQLPEDSTSTASNRIAPLIVIGALAVGGLAWDYFVAGERDPVKLALMTAISIIPIGLAARGVIRVSALLYSVASRTGSRISARAALSSSRRIVNASKKINERFARWTQRFIQHRGNTVAKARAWCQFRAFVCSNRIRNAKAVWRHEAARITADALVHIGIKSHYAAWGAHQITDRCNLWLSIPRRYSYASKFWASGSMLTTVCS